MIASCLRIAAIAALSLAVAAAPLVARAAGAESSGDDKTTKDMLREMFGGEMIDHFPLQPFSISVIRDGKVTDQVNIAIVIETKGDKNKNKVIAERYRIYDAYLRELHGLLSLKRSDGQLFDQEVVKIRLSRVSEKLLGAGVVNNILVRGISQRPL